jgi:hypothetical protein
MVCIRLCYCKEPCIRLLSLLHNNYDLIVGPEPVTFFADVAILFTICRTFFSEKPTESIGHF